MCGNRQMNSILTIGICYIQTGAFTTTKCLCNNNNNNTRTNKARMVEKTSKLRRGQSAAGEKESCLVFID